MPYLPKPCEQPVVFKRRFPGPTTRLSRENTTWLVEWHIPRLGWWHRFLFWLGFRARRLLTSQGQMNWLTEWHTSALAALPYGFSAEILRWEPIRFTSDFRPDGEWGFLREEWSVEPVPTWTTRGGGR